MRPRRYLFVRFAREASKRLVPSPEVKTVRISAANHKHCSGRPAQVPHRVQTATEERLRGDDRTETAQFLQIVSENRAQSLEEAFTGPAFLTFAGNQPRGFSPISRAGYERRRRSILALSGCGTQRI